MAKRKSTGKRLRFEIFKRDGFRCVYCGANPTQKAIRVDHVVPVALGGKTEASNLVTACFDCNAGKSSVPLDSRTGGVETEELRERAAQILGYLEAVREMEAARKSVSDAAVSHWQKLKGLTTLTAEDASIRRFCEWFDLEDIFWAMDRAHSQRSGCSPQDLVDSFRYFCGIVHSWRRGREPRSEGVR